MYALGLVGVALFVFFNWQVQQMVHSLDTVSDGLGHSKLIVMIAGLVFGVILVSSWFVAKQVISPPPLALQALPLKASSWLNAQLYVLFAALMLLNTAVALPLFVALGRLLGGHMALWLIFAETAMLLYILLGLCMYLLTEKLISMLARKTGIRPQALAVIHIAGQVAIMCLVGYSRLVADGKLGQFVPGIEAQYVIEGLFGARPNSYAVALGLLCLGILLAWLLIRKTVRSLPVAQVAKQVNRPLTSLLPEANSAITGLIRSSIRSMLSDKDISLPNAVVLVVLLGASLFIRLGVLSPALAPVLHGVYDVILVMLFASWGLSVRGRLGMSRSTIYQLPLTPGRLIGTIAVASLVSIVTIYILGDILVYFALGDPLAAGLSAILQSALLLMCVAAVALATGVISYSGQKSRLSQLPVALFFAVTTILLLTLLSWLQGRYGFVALVAAAACSVVISIGVATRYESEHILDAS